MEVSVYAIDGQYLEEELEGELEEELKYGEKLLALKLVYITHHIEQRNARMIDRFNRKEKRKTYKYGGRKRSLEI